MRSVVFAVFGGRSEALRARRALDDATLAEPGRGARLHERSLDPMLGVELSGTLAQSDGERRVAVRFGVPFAIAALAGLLIDLWLGIDRTGLTGTMALGSLGIAVGTLAVLVGARQPLDEALVVMDQALAGGRVVLSVPVETDATDLVSIRETVRVHGGQVVFQA